MDNFDDWWQTHGLNLAHRDACFAAYQLGVTCAKAPAPMRPLLIENQRRIVESRRKGDPHNYPASPDSDFALDLAIREGRKTEMRLPVTTKSPIGTVGDLLYLQEPHYLWGSWSKSDTDDAILEFTPNRERGVLFERPTNVRYSPQQGERSNPLPPFLMEGWYARKSNTMPRWAARTILKITCVTQEPLNAISRPGILAEGIEYNFFCGYKKPGYSFGNGLVGHEKPIDALRELWKLLGKKFNALPVWVIRFSVQTHAEF